MRNRLLSNAQTIVFVVSVAYCTLAAGEQPRKLICVPQSSRPASLSGIKDPAEESALLAALNTAVPEERGALLDAFIHEHPASVARMDAAEQALTAFQQARDWAKAGEAATHILQDEPDNVCALAVLLSIRRLPSTTDYNGFIDDAERGLELLKTWPRPHEVHDAEYEERYDAMAAIFYGTAGFGAFLAKNYLRARDYYLKSLSIDPENLMDDYQLGITDLEMSPVDANGFWYVAKAINLARKEGDDNSASRMAIYGAAKYRKYHGTEDGWQQIISSTARESAPPAGFTVIQLQKAH